MRAGPLRHRCTLQREQDARAPGGGLTTAWVDIGNLWAEVTTPTGRVAVVANQLQAVVSAEIRIRPRADVVAGMRLVQKLNGTFITFLIEAALPDNDRSMLRLLCSSVINP